MRAALNTVSFLVWGDEQGHAVAYFIWFFVVVFIVSKGGMAWVVLAGGLALVFVAGRTRIIPRLRRHLKKLARQRQAEKTGLDGELKIKASLEQRGLPVLHDVYLPHPDASGALTQIDLIALSWRGIHVLEVKAHAATIQVDPQAAEWPVAYPSGFETMLYNPIMQNSTHLAAVTKMVGQEVPAAGAVIFPGATLQFLEPAEGVHADIPESLEAGAPADAVVAAWERLSEHDRTSNKDQCRKAHMAALNTPKVHEDSPELRNTKKLARAAWITGCQAELLTEAKLRDVQRVVREATYQGAPIQCIKTSFATACERAKIEAFRIHDMRHTFASHLVQNGVPLLEVKDLLGHKTLAMVMRYAHLAPDNLRSAVDRLPGHSLGIVQQQPERTAVATD